MCVGGGFCGSREERFYLFVHHLRTREPFVRLSCHVVLKVTLSLTWRTGCVLWIEHGLLKRLNMVLLSMTSLRMSAGFPQCWNRYPWHCGS